MEWIALPSMTHNGVNQAFARPMASRMSVVVTAGWHWYLGGCQGGLPRSKVSTSCRQEPAVVAMQGLRIDGQPVAVTQLNLSDNAFRCPGRTTAAWGRLGVAHRSSRSSSTWDIKNPPQGGTLFCNASPTPAKPRIANCRIAEVNRRCGLVSTGTIHLDPPTRRRTCECQPTSGWRALVSFTHPCLHHPYSLG